VEAIRTESSLVDRQWPVRLRELDTDRASATLAANLIVIIVGSVEHQVRQGFQAGWAEEGMLQKTHRLAKASRMFTPEVYSAVNQCGVITLRAPRGQDLLNLTGNSLAGSRSIDSTRERRIVLGMLMPNRCDNRRGQSLVL